ncbi:hypothetical protein QVD17_05710 [Tagetes erecta]|uniref:Uncharacterized protein n=1 Tax=Tagetes erecta TaxID=13708 RepID=A0AAD8LJ70_TARER|nr:hypothetical protein QVD17_05710 [Tagetes erecta]
MRTRNREITKHAPEFNVRVSREKKVNDNGCNDSIVNSGICSEKSSEKSSKMETSCSSRSVNEFEEIECFVSIFFLNKNMEAVLCGGGRVKVDRWWYVEKDGGGGERERVNGGGGGGFGI